MTGLVHFTSILIGFLFPIFGLASSSSPIAVVLVSLDGVGYQQLQEMDATFLQEAEVRPLKPPFPSTTFAGHATLATGVLPEKNGIVDNVFYEGTKLFRYNNDPHFFQSEPLWTWAFLQGFESRTLLWPGSYGAWNGKRHHFHLQTFEPWAFERIALLVKKQLGKWNGQKPFLLMTWTPGIDREGHLHGPQSIQVRNAWEKLKGQIRSLTQEVQFASSRIGKPVHLIFVSDHGMTSVRRHIWLSKFWTAHSVTRVPRHLSNASNVIFYEPISQEIRNVLSTLLTWREPKNPRQGVLIGSLQEGDTFIATASPLCKTLDLPWILKCPEPLGMHGYDPLQSPSMNGVIWVWPKGLHGYQSVSVMEQLAPTIQKQLQGQ